ncbi:MAG: endolytic transglycosylase MltG [Treponemataceae bacterium]|nr:endolytic transglycosylase MltG [Treponemataceae bacterium]
MKIFPKILIALFALLIIAAIALFLLQDRLMGPVAENEAEIISKSIKVPSGSSTAAIGKQLEEEGLILSSDFFYLYAKIKKIGIKSGIYRISSGMTVKEILSLLESGKQDFISVSIPEGYTLKQTAKLLEDKGVILSAADFEESCSDKTLLAEYQIPATNFEGYLFPDTYHFDPESDSDKVVRMMADNFFNKLYSITEYKDKSSAEIFYFVRLASIIEREYRIPEEAPLISSVFTNRLNTRQNGHTMGLYSCATVVYIITDILGKPHPDVVTKADTQIDNPYNTYKYEGLPPGAISNPGLIALNAAINPAKTRYKYFRVIDEAAGRHTFSENLEEHNTVVTYSVKK